MAAAAFVVPVQGLEVAPLAPHVPGAANPDALRGAVAVPGPVAAPGLVGGLAKAGAATGLALMALAGARRRGRAANHHQSAVARGAVSVGQKVSWKGKPGTAAYVGPVKFAPGEWVGVALDGGAGGMHDGMVMGVRYFTCEPRTGVFGLPADVAAAGAVPPAAAAAPAAPTPLAGSDCAVGEIEMCVGCKVLWNGKPGTVAYIGDAKFAAGEWVGVALDEPAGMHDGTVMGVTYFSCTPRHGIFSMPSMLKVTAAAP